MTRAAEPSRNDRGQGVYGVRTGTPWDSLWPALARFTNSVADFTRDELHILYGVSHDTDLPKKKRRIFTTAGGTITHAPGQRGNPTYTWQGERIGKKRAFKIVHQIKSGAIPRVPVVPLPLPNGPSAADRIDYSNPAFFGALYGGPRRRFKRKKKKKSRLRDAAAVLAATASRAADGLKYGEEVFADLLGQARGAVRYVEPLFDRLIKKAPMSDFERLLHDRPYRAPLPDAGAAAEAVVSVAARAATTVALLLWPSSIGEEPPWQPPAAGPRTQTRPGPVRPVPAPIPRRVPLPSSPRPQPRPLPARPPRQIVVPVDWPQSAPQPEAVRMPAPAPAPLPAPSTRPAPSPSPSAFPISAAFPFFAPSIAPRSATRPQSAPSGRPGRSPLPIVSPLTRVQPYPLTSPSDDRCNCAKPNRERQRKKCTNPIVSKRTRGNLQTITRRLQCPVSSRKKPS